MLQLSDLTYLGAFRVPTNEGSDTTYASLNKFGAGRGLGFNPSTNRLFITGREGGYWVMEMDIPVPVNGSVGSMNRATMTQSWREITNIGNIDGDTNNEVWLKGILVSAGGRLVFSGYRQYDAANPRATKSHVYKTGTTLAGGTLNGPYAIAQGIAEAGWIGGYMARIPSAYQSALGGPVFTGINTISITDRTSSGPSVSVFDPDQLGSSGGLASTVLGYPIAHPYHNSGQVTSAIWNNASLPHACVFPEGYRSVVFLGTHGTGSLCYGDVPGECSDPVMTDKGYHASPYRPQAWVFDVEDLIAAKQGSVNIYDILEQSAGIWNLSSLIPSWTSNHSPGGAAYDPATKLIYWVQRGADSFGAPIVHVIQHA